MLLSFSCIQGQFVHFHWHHANNDSDTRKKLTEIIIAIALRDASLHKMNNSLKQMIRNQEDLLRNDYAKTKYDIEQDKKFKKAMTITGVFATGSTIASYSNASYLTNNKKEYIKRINSDKLALAFLNTIDNKAIHTDNRQQIYRLRNKLIKLYSKNDKVIRKLLLLPAAAYAVENKTELLKLLKALDIVL